MKQPRGVGDSDMLDWLGSFETEFDDNDHAEYQAYLQSLERRGDESVRVRTGRTGDSRRAD